jgi:hypothetical protein
MYDVDPTLIVVLVFCAPICILLILILGYNIYKVCCFTSTMMIYPDNTIINNSIPLKSIEMGKDCFITINPKAEELLVTIAIRCD